jgi:alpha-L-rhamnosidase
MMQFHRSKSSVLAVFFTLVAISMSNAQTTEPSQKQSSITEFGAVGDGKTINTVAIQKAIDTLASSGGGTVVVPEGTFISGAIFMKPGVNLRVDKNGVLKGSTDVNDYPKMNTRVEGHFEPWLPALVNADGIDHLRISGEGTLDGSGAPFYTAFYNSRNVNRAATNLGTPRPRMMFVANSKDVQISGLHFLNSGFWNLHLYRCQNVLVEGLDIWAPVMSPSTDGIDVDSCQYITIKGCRIANNDDGIALKGSKGPLAMEDKDSPPVEHIHVIDCTFVRGGRFVTCGSEGTIIRDVVVENCQSVPPESGTSRITMMRLKLRTDTPQLYEDIHFKNIKLAGQGMIIGIAPWSQFFDLQGQKQPTRMIRNVTISNVTGSFGSFGSVGGGPGDVIEDVTLENIDVQLTRPNPPNLSFIKKGLVIKNVKINGKEYTGPATAPSAATQP